LYGLFSGTNIEKNLIYN